MISALVGLFCLVLILVMGLLWILIAIAVVAYKSIDGKHRISKQTNHYF